jgi:hypothetical protein
MLGPSVLDIVAVLPVPSATAKAVGVGAGVFIPCAGAAPVLPPVNAVGAGAGADEDEDEDVGADGVDGVDAGAGSNGAGDGDFSWSRDACWYGFSDMSGVDSPIRLPSLIINFLLSIAMYSRGSRWLFPILMT